MATDYKLRVKASDQTKGAFNSVNKNINSTQSAMKKLAGAFAGVFAVRQLVQFGRESLEVADAIAKTADSIGVSVDFLQRYQFVAQQAGLSTEEFNKSMTVFAKMTGEAATGVGEAKMALEALGVSLNRSDGKMKTTEELFLDFFRATDSVAEANKKAAYFSDVFGRAGVKNTVMAKEGTAAMQDMAEAATGIFSEESIRNAEKFNDTMNKLNRQVLTPIRDKFIGILGMTLELAEKVGVLDFEVTTKNLTELRVKMGQLSTDMAEIMQQMNQPNANIEMLSMQLKELMDLSSRVGKRIRALMNQGEDGEQNAVQAALDGYISSLGTIEERLGKAATTSMKKFEDSIINTLKTGKSGFKDFADYVVEQLLRIAIQEMIISPLKGTFSSFFSKFNFDGGGYTGMGARAGGVDGKGGFPAILHPNETVVDHTKGQGMGGTTVNFNISTVDAAGFDQLLASRKGLITSIINNAMNNQGKMGVV